MDRKRQICAFSVYGSQTKALQGIATAFCLNENAAEIMLMEEYTSNELQNSLNLLLREVIGRIPFRKNQGKIGLFLWLQHGFNLAEFTIGLSRADSKQVSQQRIDVNVLKGRMNVIFFESRS